MFTVDVFPAINASNRDTYRIEIVLEVVNGGIWDSTDEEHGRLRYRLFRSTRQEAEATATELISMHLNADVAIDHHEPECLPPPEVSVSMPPETIAASARAA